MENELIFDMLDRFGLLETFLVFTLWKCLKEIRELYRTMSLHQEERLQELKTTLTRYRAGNGRKPSEEGDG